MGFPGWMPPTETERRLCEAAARGDWQGQVAAIAGEDLYLAAPQHGQDPLPVYDDPAVGGKCIPVLTRAMLPPWHPQQFFDRITLEDLAQDWPNDKWQLAVNPGTPSAAYFPASPAHRSTWLQLRAQGGVRPGGLLTTHLGGPTHGPLAQALACGAPIAVHHSVPWNELGTTFLDNATDARTLREQWSVVDPASWQQRLRQLVEGRFVPAETEAALRARSAASPSGAGGTRDSAREPAADGKAEEAGQASDAAAEPSAPGVPEMPELVRTYEERFRTDGVLLPDGQVKSLVALDLVHAVALVRWGLSARYCSPPEAEPAVLEIGARAKAAYSSWEEFSAGYLLGRMLAFDNGWFGTHYAEALHIHRVLTQDPGSPWRGLPFA
ncbi:DUF1266 domain-containing protein [Streptomyces sp. NPDC003077]|uniref:DUF1266 domain-containing protein n=1 Tax=Streptomyces sp. NPDC003077 TaxID=3154443 RepID=UPI0033A64724